MEASEQNTAVASFSVRRLSCVNQDSTLSHTSAAKNVKTHSTVSLPTYHSYLRPNCHCSHLENHISGAYLCTARCYIQTRVVHIALMG